MNKQIVIKVKGTKTVDLLDLEEFQGNLKTLDKKNMQKLKDNLIRNGFITPVFIWEKYILDGHSRLKALKELLKNGYDLVNLEGISTNNIPVVSIEASTVKQAAEYVLSISSHFGKIKSDGLKDFAEAYALELFDLSDFIDLDVKLEPINNEVKPLNESVNQGFMDGEDSAEEVDKLGKHVITCPSCGHTFKRK